MITANLPGIRNVLCLGAHADDIELGCGGTILRLTKDHPSAHFFWLVLSAPGTRRDEAEASAERFLRRAGSRTIDIQAFRDGFFPYDGARIKEHFEHLKSRMDPDIVLTHQRDDLHQDHRLLAELTWNTFRNSLILEYEIPKFDGDLGSPNVFMPLTDEERRRKLEFLLSGFPSQKLKDWFTESTFDAMMRLRGMECRSSSGYAEAFYCRKLCIG